MAELLSSHSEWNTMSLTLRAEQWLAEAGETRGEAKWEKFR